MNETPTGGLKQSHQSPFKQMLSQSQTDSVEQER